MRRRTGPHPASAPPTPIPGPSTGGPPWLTTPRSTSWRTPPKVCSTPARSRWRGRAPAGLRQPARRARRRCAAVSRTLAAAPAPTMPPAVAARLADAVAAESAPVGHPGAAAGPSGPARGRQPRALRPTCTAHPPWWRLAGPRPRRRRDRRRRRLRRLRAERRRRAQRAARPSASALNTGGARPARPRALTGLRPRPAPLLPAPGSAPARSPRAGSPGSPGPRRRRPRPAGLHPRGRHQTRSPWSPAATTRHAPPGRPPRSRPLIPAARNTLPRYLWRR